MKLATPSLCALLIGAALQALPSTLLAQAAPQAKAPAPAASSSALPADPWPRQVNLTNGTVLMYQPQVSSWVGNRIEFRAALAIHPKGAKGESFGVLFATAAYGTRRLVWLGGASAVVGGVIAEGRVSRVRHNHSSLQPSCDIASLGKRRRPANQSTTSRPHRSLYLAGEDIANLRRDFYGSPT